MKISSPYHGDSFKEFCGFECVGLIHIVSYSPENWLETGKFLLLIFAGFPSLIKIIVCKEI
jgi:hypothetical protein